MLTCVLLSSLAKVFSGEKPLNPPFRSFSMLKNERSSFQAAFYSDENDEVKAEIDSPLAGAITMYSVEEIPSALPAYPDRDDYYLKDTPGLYPDLLRPASGVVALPAGKWRALWFELDPAGAVPAGRYPVRILLTGKKETACNCVDVEIIGAELPGQTLIHTNWFHTDCLATRYKAEVFGEECWRVTENFLKNAARHGMNMVLTPLFTPPLDTALGGERPTVQLVDVFVDGGEYRFGFEKLKRWVEMCGRCGINYLEMSHLFTQWGAKRAPKIEAVVDGKQRKLFGWNTLAGGKKYTEFLTAFADALNRFLNENGLKDRCFFHVSDEPNSAQIPAYRKRGALVRRLFPDYPVIDALSDFGFYKKGLIKTPIPATNHIEPFIGNVPELWAYYCCGQHKDYVSNRFFAMPSERNRLLGLQLYKYGVKGFLQWGHNFWYSQFSRREIDPFKESDAGKAFPSGDAYVVYPGENGAPLNSLRLKVFYDALQDMRALQLLESLCGREKTLALLEKGLDVPLTFKFRPPEEEWLLQKRAEINEAITLYTR